MTPIRKSAKKSERRVIAKARRAALTSLRAKAARQVAKVGLRDIGLQSGAVIAGYFPQDEEFDVLPLLERLRDGGHRIALPVVVARQAALVFRQWVAGVDPVPGAMGIPIPPENAPCLRPDIVLVPFLEADEFGHRLGYGGGYYDRTLTDFRRRGDVIAIGVGYAGQIVAEVPRDAHDARLDAILTEKGLTHMPRKFDGPPR